MGLSVFRSMPSTSPMSKVARVSAATMLQPDPFAPSPEDAPQRFEVRSITGACYTLVEESGVDTDTGQVQRRYRTAYAGLPVVANEDGTFTIVDTHTRLTRVAAR